MSKTTVTNSMGSATVKTNGDGSLRLSIDSHTDGPALIDLSPDFAAIIGSALTGEPAPFLENARFEDVSKGDLVRLEITADGRMTRHEGVAHHLAHGNWVTAEGEPISGPNSTRLGFTITILSRPTPQLPTEPGAVILFDKAAFVLESRPVSLDLVWRNLANPNELYSREQLRDVQWELTGLKVVEA